VIKNHLRWHFGSASMLFKWTTIWSVFALFLQVDIEVLICNNLLTQVWTPELSVFEHFPAHFMDFFFDSFLTPSWTPVSCSCKAILTS
jgi:hypothetical protein